MEAVTDFVLKIRELYAYLRDAVYFALARNDSVIADIISHDYSFFLFAMDVGRMQDSGALF